MLKVPSPMSNVQSRKDQGEGELCVVSRVVGMSCEAFLPHPYYSLPDTLPTTHPHPKVKQRGRFYYPKRVSVIIRILFILSTYQLVNLSTPVYAAPPEKEKEVVIKGEIKAPPVVEKIAPDLSLDISEILPWETKADEEILNPEPPEYRTLKEKAVPLLHSDRTCAFWLPPLTQEEVAIFYLLPQGDIAEWKLEIVNSKGEVVTKFGKKSKPPASIIWRGYDKRGWGKRRVIRVGEPYSFIYTTWDYTGNQSRFIGKTFSVDSLVYETSEGLAMNLAFKTLFVEEENISRKGGELLRTAADIIKQYPRSSIALELYGTERALLTRQAERISDFLNEHLTIGENQLKIRADINPEEGYPFVKINLHYQ